MRQRKRQLATKPITVPRPRRLLRKNAEDASRSPTPCPPHLPHKRFHQGATGRAVNCSFSRQIFRTAAGDDANTSHTSSCAQCLTCPFYIMVKKGSGLRPSSHSVPQQARSFSHFFDSNLLCSIPECILHGHPIPLLNTTRQRLAQRTAVRVEQRWTPLGFFNPYCLNDSILPFFVSSHSQRDFTLALSYIGTWKRFTVVRKAHHFFHRAMLVQQSHRDQSLVTVDLCELRQSQHHLPPAALLGAIVDDIDEAFLLLQIRQEPPGADHVIAHSQWWSMGFQHQIVFKPATCLNRPLPSLPPSSRTAHHKRHTTNYTASYFFTLLSVPFSDPPNAVFDRKQTTQ